MQDPGYLSMVIPTRNRYVRLVKTLRGLAGQAIAPEEVVVVVASDDLGEDDRLSVEFSTSFINFSAVRAKETGAAVQRNQGVVQARGDLIGFCDDDVDFEPNCISSLRLFLAEHPPFVGVAATVVNQAPRRIGRITRGVLKQLDDKPGLDFDGRVVGPGLNLYPIFDPSGAVFRETEWLNLGTTIYRKAALPKPPFPVIFRGYSFGEDLALSCCLARAGKLAVLRDARIFHDSQTGDHKSDERAVARMDVINRFYIATTVLARPRVKSWCQLVVWYSFCFVANARRCSWSTFLRRSVGTLEGLTKVVLGHA